MLLDSKMKEMCSFEPTQLIILILKLAPLNDDQLNTGVWPNLEIYAINYYNYGQSPHKFSILNQRLSHIIKDSKFNA